MPYNAEISRRNPTCMIFLIDQSGSMDEVIDPENARPLREPVTIDGRVFTHQATGDSKAASVATIINRQIHNLILRSTKNDGVRDYFHVAVFGYGGTDNRTHVTNALPCANSERALVPVSLLAERPTRIEERKKKTPDGVGGLVEEVVKIPVWIDPVASGGTPMGQALRRATEIAKDWVENHPQGYPPSVLHLTDGESTDGDPFPASEELRRLASQDGNVLLFNCHISSTRAGTPTKFPSNDAELPDAFAKKLFQMSSVLTPFQLALAQQESHSVKELARGYVFNADPVAIIEFFDIGTKVDETNANR